MPLVVVEDRVGHRDLLDVGNLHDLVDVVGWILGGEVFAPLGEILIRRIEAELLEGRQHAAAGLGDRRAIDEQVLEDVIGLRLLVHSPEDFVGDNR